MQLKTCLLLALAALAISSGQLPAAEVPMPGNFSNERIYSVITSRFFDGDVDNNFYNRDRIEEGDPHYRGDFKGLAQKLAYIKPSLTVGGNRCLPVRMFEVYFYGIPQLNSFVNPISVALLHLRFLKILHIEMTRAFHHPLDG